MSACDQNVTSSYHVSLKRFYSSLCVSTVVISPRLFKEDILESFVEEEWRLFCLLPSSLCSTCPIRILHTNGYMIQDKQNHFKHIFVVLLLF